MKLSTRVKGFLRTGKLNIYDQLKETLLEEGQDDTILDSLDKLSFEQKELLINDCWVKLSNDRKRLIAYNIYLDKWTGLVVNFAELRDIEKVKRLEILGFISCKEVVAFLLEQMKSKKEEIRLTACGALKRQDPQFLLGPILHALTQPDQWLPSRVFEILRAIGPGLEEQLLLIFDSSEESAQGVIIQILGEIGSRSCLPLLEKSLGSANSDLRFRIAEALEKLCLQESWTLLVKLLKDERWQTRLMAAKAFGQVGKYETRSFLQDRKNIEQDPLVLECIDDALELIEEKSLQVVINWVREG
ncbi:MAG: hypothetical protein VR72_16485 [Clostridiaceae bacterium BRH_c20a]|nr:MAG: hypothetical protein VR72_16485 [Clostridiaceae bacterium BRH_c20a]